MLRQSTSTWSHSNSSPLLLGSMSLFCCPRKDCDKRYDPHRKSGYLKHLSGCRVHSAESAAIEATIDLLEDNMLEPLVRKAEHSPVTWSYSSLSRSMRWTIATTELNPGWFHDASPTSYPNPSRAAFDADPEELEDINTATRSEIDGTDDFMSNAMRDGIDNLIFNKIETAYAIDNELIRLLNSPSKNQRANLVQLALPISCMT